MVIFENDVHLQSLGVLVFVLFSTLPPLEPFNYNLWEKEEFLGNISHRRGQTHFQHGAIFLHWRNHRLCLECLYATLGDS